jgi:hypothetical protein
LGGGSINLFICSFEKRKKRKKKKEKKR